MKNRMILLAIGCLVLISVTSCTSSDNITKVIYTSVEKYDCWEKAENIYLFKDGDSLNFEYYEIGTVESEAEKGPKEYLAESHLKYKAWDNYANAVINLKEETVQNTKRLKGQAVKIKQDSVFYAKYGRINDLNFLDDLNIKRKPESKTNPVYGWLIFVGSIFVVLIVAFMTSVKVVPKLGG
jgi:hypothetical protein